ncbi:hypothetical protein BDN72DRAFT_840041 [Pluteus cervinus]|uniref:Uncharacterized protein n=1 Tax=Pluteus cervinus TaxID=181527 RepID=A0ACD3AVD4_9AGAR|nr:hypothetical protein BDN72DRAFT_840041 [Pluteus cervinus]
MPSLGKFSAWIEVDQEHLPEFRLEVSNESSTVTCWVPSEAGKQFAVFWRDPNLQYTLDGDVSVDGQRCAGALSEYPKEKGDVTAWTEAVATGPFTSRALVFSKIELTDDDQYLQESVGESFGEIKLILSKAIITGTETACDQSACIPDDVKVHERSKKGMDHRIGLGDEWIRTSSDMTTVESICDVATFVFRYRPLAILQANGIAPIDRSTKRKASTPPNEPSDDEDDGEAAAEIEALKARLRDLEGRQKKRVKIEVKTEPHSGLYPPNNLDVIDLTDLD